MQARHEVPAAPRLEGEDLVVDFKRLPKVADSPSPDCPVVSGDVDDSKATVDPTVRKQGKPAIDLAMDLLERDAERMLRHRAMERMLADLAFKLVALTDLDAGDWRDWVIELQAELQRRAPPCHVEAWAKQCFEKCKLSSG